MREVPMMVTIAVAAGAWIGASILLTAVNHALRSAGWGGPR